MTYAIVIAGLVLHVILLARVSHWAKKTHVEAKRTNRLLEYISSSRHLQ